MEVKRIKLQNKSSIFSSFSRGTRPSTRACVLGVCHPHGLYTGVYFGRVCPPVFFPSPVHGSYTGVCWACVPYTVHTWACMSDVCLQTSSLLCTRSIHGRVLGVCIQYTVHTRACILGVCLCVFPLSHTRSQYTGVCPNRMLP